MSMDNAKFTDMEENGLMILTESDLMPKIHIVRGKQVMLDYDLAAVYGYSTTRFNEQVKNNIERFDEDFRFQLTDIEFKNLMSKFSTSSWGGTRKLPYAFAGCGQQNQNSAQENLNGIECVETEENTLVYETTLCNLAVYDCPSKSVKLDELYHVVMHGDDVADVEFSRRRLQPLGVNQDVDDPSVRVVVSALHGAFR